MGLVLGEFFCVRAEMGLVLGEFFCVRAEMGLVLGEFFRATGLICTNASVLFRVTATWKRSFV